MDRESQEAGTPGRDAGTAYIAEMFEVEDSGRMSGLFCAHWEIDADAASGPRSVDGPEDVTLEAALAWARERSDAVLVQVGGGEAFYSAGVTDLTYDGDDEDDPTPILSWPEEGLVVASRPVESALDGSEQIVLWRIHMRDMPLDVWARVAELVAADDLVVRIEGPTDPAETADVIVRGGGMKTAFLPLYRLIERSLRELGFGADDVRFNLRMVSDDQRDVD